MNSQKNFQVYRSSAGSGKTFTLTKEYLKLAIACPGLFGEFHPRYFKTILAVTFTNAAANEMKERILGKLAAFSQKTEETDEMLLMIEAELKAQYPEQEFSLEVICKRAHTIHQHILHNYSDFSVSTIDSFNHRIVQSFKKDLGLPFNYEIEFDKDGLLQKAVDLLQNEVGEKLNKELSELLSEFTIYKADEGKSWFIDEDLIQFGKNIFHEEHYEAIAPLQGLELSDFKKLKNRLVGYVNEIDKSVKKLSDQALQLIEQHQLEAKSFYQGARGIYGYFQKHSLLSQPFYSIPANNYVKKTIDEDKWTKTKPSSFEEQAIETIKSQLRECFLQIEEIKQQETDLYIVASSLKNSIYLLATIHLIESQLQAVKAENNLVHISDFNRKINQIVEHEPVPYIFERIGEKYNHILVDEFQDTSQMQWHNLMPLVVNTLAKGMFNLIVGDAKQAIYRFRGGKSDLLVALPDSPSLHPESNLYHDTQVFHNEINVSQLQKNFRSKANIITFNNSFFEFFNTTLQEAYPDLPDYFNEVQQESNTQQGGHISIWTCPQEHAAQATLAQTLTLVEHLIHQESYKPSDIAILTRKNTEGAAISKHLIAAGYAVLSSESLLLNSSATIQFILNFFKVSLQPYDLKVKFDILYYLINQEGGEDVDSIIELLEEMKAIDNEAEQLALFQNYLSQHHQIHLDLHQLRNRSLHEIAEDIIRKFNLWSKVQEKAYLYRFLDVLSDYSQKNGNHLLDFLDFWNKKGSKFSIATPENANAIRVMTIHKSKGLQFPVVILPFAEWTTTPNTNHSIWRKWPENPLTPELSSVLLPYKKDLKQTRFAQDYQEEKQAAFLDAYNLLYVALTRPEEKLFILCKEQKTMIKPDEGVNNCGQLILHYLEKGPLQHEDSACKVSIQKPLPANVDCKLHLYFRDEKKPHYPKGKSLKSSKAPSIHLLHTDYSHKIQLRRNEGSGSESLLSVVDLYHKRVEGILVHQAFEFVKYQKDIPKAIQKMLNKGYITKEDGIRLQKTMEKVVNLPEINTYFQPHPGLRVLTEREVIIPQAPNRYAILRPDRIVFYQGLVILMDYKTGIEELEKHKKQINRYASVLRKMGYKKIRKLIIYTEQARVEEV
ncbi:UvrD-helicase domain-containing protein [Rapidithrix thailandica]|uniref:DNA 3'-5' helicase n=1 Tax=Rapidithrix thailandica TaxID=413964 RepID=A0AAW9SJZ5_9BACT